MGDVKNPKFLDAKGAMMLLVGILASAPLLAGHLDAKTALYPQVAVWGLMAICASGFGTLPPVGR